VIYLWISLVALMAMAVAFTLWPWIAHRRQLVDARTAVNEVELAENVRLFQEHMAELEAQLSDGRLDKQQFAQLKLEQERALLQDDAELRQSAQTKIRRAGLWFFTALGVAVLSGAVVLYARLGASQDEYIRALQLDKQYADYQDMLANRQPDPQHARAVINAVEQRLRTEPDNVQYWFVLARSAMELGDFAQAAKAYQEVLARDAQSGMIMAETAQALFLRDGNQVTPPVVDLTKSALVLEPENTMALGLMGIINFGDKDYLGAIRHWRKAVKLLGEGAPGADSLNQGIERAKGLYIAGGGNETELEKAVAGRQITLAVSLATGIKINPDQWIYVYARAWHGPKMPLAITRIKASTLPAEVKLTEAMAMSPSASLASADQIELVARVSGDGTATAQPGDWQGSQGPFDTANLPERLGVVIDHQLADQTK